MVQISEYFPKPKIFRCRCKIWIRFVSLCRKADLKDATGVDTSDFAKKKTGLANLKFDVDKLDIDKLKNVPNNLSNLKIKVDKLDVNKLVPGPDDLSKLSDVVKNDVLRKHVYKAKIKNIEYEISDITNVATYTTLNAKVNEIKDNIPSITNLGTTTALTAVKNKIPII